MKKMIIGIVALLYAAVLAAQTPTAFDSLRKELDALRTSYREAQTLLNTLVTKNQETATAAAAAAQENDELRQKLIAIDREYYETEKQLLQKVLMNSRELSVKWSYIKGNIEQNQGMATITQINNIGQGNALGFDFVSTMTSLVQSTLTASLEASAATLPAEARADAQARWKTIVGRIVNNNLVQGLAQSNPITSIASSLITSALNFTSQNVSATNVALKPAVIPEKYSDFRSGFYSIMQLESQTTTQAAPNYLISPDSIASFAKKIQLYADIYDGMSISNMAYQAQLNELIQAHKEYDEVISSYNKKLLTLLEADMQSNAMERINTLLKVDETVSFPAYRAVIDKLGDLRKHAAHYEAMRIRTNSLITSYYEIQISYYRAYVKHLKKARDGADKGVLKFDVRKINETVAQLNTGIKSLQTSLKNSLMEE